MCVSLVSLAACSPSSVCFVGIGFGTVSNIDGFGRQASRGTKSLETHATPCVSVDIAFVHTHTHIYVHTSTHTHIRAILVAARVIRYKTMGNEQSSDGEPDTNRFLEEGFNLESPDADVRINYGTSAPNCQPKHTAEREQAGAAESLPDYGPIPESVPRLDGAIRDDPQRLAGTSHEAMPLSPKHRRDSGDTSMGDDHKRQHTSVPPPSQPTLPSRPAPQEPVPPKKLSYLQMAKLGYQELVNAIIRPPRADYKVSLSYHTPSQHIR